MSKIDIARADLSFEATFPEPDFGMFAESQALLDHVFRGLVPQGLRLNDLRIERGTGAVSEHQIVAHLFNYSMTIRFRVDKVEVNCTDLPTTHVEALKNAVVTVLAVVLAHRPKVTFRAFGLSVGMHAVIEGTTARDFLARFAASVPTGLGPSTGNGVVFYFGADGLQLNASITADISAVVGNAVFLRTQAAWDAQQLKPESLLEAAEQFRMRALGSIGLEAVAYI